jgi:hypothetical protein
MCERGIAYQEVGLFVGLFLGILVRGIVYNVGGIGLRRKT